MKAVKKSGSPPSLQAYIDSNPDETWEALNNERAVRDELCLQLLIDQGGAAKPLSSSSSYCNRVKNPKKSWC